MLLEIGKHKYNFSSTYESLNYQDFVLFFKIQQKKVSVLEKKLDFLKEKISLKHFLLMNEVQISQILLEIELFEENFKFYDLPKIFQSVTINGKKYNYFGKTTMNRRFEQFTKIQHIIKYESNDINKIMAVVYANHENYIDGYEERIKFFEKEKNEIRQVAIANYLNDCEKLIQDKFLSKFPKDDQDTAHGWFNNMLDIAKTQIFGDVEKVKKAYFLEIAHFINQNAEANPKN